MKIDIETFKSYEETVHKYSEKTKRIRLINNISAPLCNLLFSLLLLPGVYGGIRLIATKGQVKILKTFSPLFDVWRKYLLFINGNKLPVWLAFVICFLSAIIITVLVKAVIIGCVNLFYKKTNFVNLEGEEKSRVSSLLQKARTAYSSPTKAKVSLNITSFIVFLGLGIYVYVKLLKNTKKFNVEKNLFDAIFKVLPVFIVGIIAYLLGKKIYNLITSKFLKLESIYGVILKLESAEKSIKSDEKKAAEIAKKREREEIKRKIAKEKEKREKQVAKEKLERAEKIYAEAIAQEPNDYKKIKEAADLGHPKACSIIGLDLIEKWTSDLITKSEKDSIIRQARDYLEKAKNVSTDCEFLWLFCRVNIEKNSSSDWHKILNNLRGIKESGNLSEEYIDTCDRTIKSVVEAIDTLADSSKENNSNNSKNSNKEPVVKRKYCAFCNAGICTRHSTSYYMAHCNYMSDPGQCSTALLDKGLRFEFE